MAERIKRNTSKIEVLANKDEINNLLEAEFPVSLIWKTLQSKGKISCKYHAFLKSVKKICKNEKKHIENNGLQKKQIIKNNSQKQSEARSFHEENKGADDLV